MPTLRDILLDAGLPCGISLVILVLGQLIFWRKLDPFNRWMPGLAMAAALVVGLGFVFAWPRLPPSSAMDWPAWIAVLLVPAAVLTALVQGSFVARALVAGVLMALVAWLLLRTQIDKDWAAEAACLWIAKPACVAAIFWLLLDGLSVRSTGAGLPVVLMVSATACAATVSLYGSLKLGLAFGALAAVTGPLFVVALWARLFSIQRAGALVWAVTYCGLLIASRAFLGTLPLRSALILVGAPLLAWIDQAPGINRLSAPWRAGIQVVLVVVALAFAVVPAVIMFRETGGE
jgi:hypothetical protein